MRTSVLKIPKFENCEEGEKNKTSSGQTGGKVSTNEKKKKK